MKYKLYLDDDYIFTYETFNTALEGARKHWVRRGLNPKYIRMWKEDNETIIDYSSHNNFYKIKEVE